MVQDYAHEWTDKKLQAFENKIAREYKSVIETTQQKVSDYLNKFQEEDEAKQQEVRNGVITQKEYKKWRYDKILLAVGFLKLLDALADDFYKINLNVSKMIKAFSREIYAENYNYGTYEVEKGTHLDTNYELLSGDDVSAVKDKPLSEKKDKAWNKQQMKSILVNLLLNEKRPINKVSKKFAKEISKKNILVSVRAAERMATANESAGRTDSYERAQDMGVNGILREWIATLDNRTRHTHRLLDGQRRKVNEPFQVEGYTIRFPGDPQAAAEMRCNCRCWIICLTGEAQYVPNMGKGNVREKVEVNSEVGNQTYLEWKHYRAK